MLCARISAPSSPIQFSKKLIRSYSRFGSLAKASAVILAPLTPTLLTPQRRLSFLRLVSVCSPSITCLYPRYPKFLVATPRSRTFKFCSFERAFPTCYPPSFVIPLKSRLNLSSFNWVSFETLLQMLLAPTYVKLLKQRSISKECRLLSCSMPSATGLIPSAPNLLLNRFRLRTFKECFASERYSLRASPNYPDSSSPINTKVRFYNFLNCFSPSRTAFPPQFFSEDRMKDSLKLFRSRKFGNSFPTTSPGADTLQIASRDRSKLQIFLGILLITNSSPLSVILVLPKFSFSYVRRGSRLENKCARSLSSNYEEAKLISAALILG